MVFENAQVPLQDLVVDWGKIDAAHVVVSSGSRLDIWKRSAVSGRFSDMQVFNLVGIYLKFVLFTQAAR